MTKLSLDPLEYVRLTKTKVSCLVCPFYKGKRPEVGVHHVQGHSRSKRHIRNLMEARRLQKEGKRLEQNPPPPLIPFPPNTGASSSNSVGSFQVGGSGHHSKHSTPLEEHQGTSTKEAARELDEHDDASNLEALEGASDCFDPPEEEGAEYEFNELWHTMAPGRTISLVQAEDEDGLSGDLDAQAGVEVFPSYSSEGPHEVELDIEAQDQQGSGRLLCSGL